MKLVFIGYDQSEQLVEEPAALYVRVIKRAKYALPKEAQGNGRPGVVSAPLPPQNAAAWSDHGFDPARAERAEQELIKYTEGLTHSPPGSKPAPKKAHKGGTKRALKGAAKRGTKGAPKRAPKGRAKRPRPSR